MATATQTTKGRTYGLTLAALVTLTLTSWGASRLELGTGPHVAIGLSIAFIKAVIVALFFMHLHKAPYLLKLVLTVTATFVLILTLGILIDVAWR